MRYKDQAWFEAVHAGETDALLRLLERGVDINTCDGLGRPALAHFVQANRVDAVRLLVDQGAGIDAEWGRSSRTTALTDAFHMAIQHSGSLRTPGDQLCEFPMVRLLLSRGIKIGLREAIALDDHDLVRRFCEQGAEINRSAGWCFDYTFLMMAAQLGRLAIVHLLLDHGADLEGTDDVGQRALMVAAEKGHVDVVQALLDRGADIDADTGSIPGTALASAAIAGQTEASHCLLGRGAQKTLQAAVAMNDQSFVAHYLTYEAYLRRGWNSELGYRVTEIAAEMGHLEILKMLLDFHHDASHRQRALQEALDAAATFGQLEAAELLVELGADPQGGDPSRGSPAGIAEYYGHLKVAEFLRKACARPAA